MASPHRAWRCGNARFHQHKQVMSLAKTLEGAVCKRFALIRTDQITRPMAEMQRDHRLEQRTLKWHSSSASRQRAHDDQR